MRLFRRKKKNPILEEKKEITKKIQNEFLPTIVKEKIERELEGKSVKEILKEKKVNAMLRELWEAEGVKESVKKIVIKQYVNLMERKRVME